ncbi:MAG: hypothetical protein ACQESC_04600 [Nanobdellota archaeon]
MNTKPISYFLAFACFAVGTVTAHVYKVYQDQQVNSHTKQHKQDVFQPTSSMLAEDNLDYIVDSVYNSCYTREVDSFTHRQEQEFFQLVYDNNSSQNSIDSSVGPSSYEKLDECDPSPSIKRENSLAMLLLMGGMYTAGIGFVAYAITRKDDE